MDAKAKALTDQRNAALDQVATLTADLAEARERIKDLEIKVIALQPEVPGYG